MTRFSGLMVVAVMLVGGGAMGEDKKEAPKFDASKLEGTWKVVEMTKYSEKAEAKDLKPVVITKDSITTKTDLGEFVFKYTVDAKSDPAAIDLEITSDQFKGMKAQGVIKMEGDKLMLAYDVAEPDAKTLTRPKSVESKKDSKTLSYVLTKAKDEKKDK